MGIEVMTLEKNRLQLNTHIFVMIYT